MSFYNSMSDNSMHNSLFNNQPAVDPFASPSLHLRESTTFSNETGFIVTFLKCEWDWDEKGKEISKYFFSIKPPGTEGWIVTKKIKEFIELEAALKKSLSKANFEKWGKIGEKGLLNGTSPASRNLKKSALEFYLTHLLTNLRQHGVVMDFINRNKVEESDIMKGAGTASGNQSSNFIKEGFLLKKGSFFNPWVVRYYRLKNFRLDYYQTKYGPVYGSIKLQSMVVYAYQGTDHDFKHALVFENDSQQFYLVLCAENDTERDEWIYHLKNVIQDARQLSPNAASPKSPLANDSFSPGSPDYSTSHLRSDAESIYMIPQDEPFSGRESLLPFSQRSLFEKVFNSQDEFNFGAVPFNMSIPDAVKPVCSGEDTKMFGVSLHQAIKNSGPAYSSADVQVPRVVHQCIEYLEQQQAFLEEGIFRLSGSSSSIKGLREKYDKEPSSFSLGSHEPDIHVVSGLLKLFFRELPDNILLPRVRISCRATGLSICSAVAGTANSCITSHRKYNHVACIVWLFEESC